MMNMTKTYFYRIFLLLTVLSMPVAVMARGEIFWPIGDGLEAQIASTGELKKITSDGQTLIGASRIFMLKANKGGTIYQGSGFVANDQATIRRSAKEVTTSGTLLDTSLSRDLEVADFTVVYKQVDDEEFQIHVEITLLKESQWQSPPRFTIALPVREYIGATLAIVDQDKVERTYTIDREVKDYEGYGFQTATITKDKMQIRFEPATATALHLQDARGWGEDYISVVLSQKEKWKRPFSYSAGEKLVFEAYVVYRLNK
jgi:hypothetical protein